MNTHENIKILRERMGLSQEELALRIGYKDRSSIAKIEAGKVDLPQSKIAAFAEVLSVSPAQLMGLTEEPPLCDDQPQLSEEEAEILQRIRTSSPEKVAAILELLK